MCNDPQRIGGREGGSPGVPLWWERRVKVILRDVDEIQAQLSARSFRLGLRLPNGPGIGGTPLLHLLHTY
jgi:hypothetical protein